MYEYSRDVFYYETDTMGVVHHSNFIRWMEEARTAYFASIGVPYDKTEAEGVLSPITGVDIRFKYFVRFGDRFTVRLRMKKYTGARLIVDYVIVNQNGEILAEAESSHAFIGRNYRPLSLAKALPDVHEVMKRCIEPDEESIDIPPVR